MTTPAVTAGVRDRTLDALRGLAIALMVADHTVVVAGGPVWARVPTRAALPLFMVVAGALWKPGVRRRHLELTAAAVASSVIAWGLELPAPDVLVVILAVLPAMGWASRWPLAALIASYAQTAMLPIGWAGYQPGTVLGWLVIGRLAWTHVQARDEMARVGRWAAPVVRLGRWPLLAYVGHLGALWAIVAWAR